MHEIKVQLAELRCARTSRGLGSDDIQLLVELNDPKNNNGVIGKAMMPVGAMSDGTVLTDVTLYDDLNAPAMDSLRCMVSVIKMGVFDDLQPYQIPSTIPEARAFLDGLRPFSLPSVPLVPQPLPPIGPQAGITMVNGGITIADAIIALVNLRGSWGSTVALGSTVVDVDVTPSPNGMHPGGAFPWYEFACASYDSSYSAKFTVFISGY